MGPRMMNPNAGPQQPNMNSAQPRNIPYNQQAGAGGQPGGQYYPQQQQSQPGQPTQSLTPQPPGVSGPQFSGAGQGQGQQPQRPMIVNQAPNQPPQGGPARGVAPYPGPAIQPAGGQQQRKPGNQPQLIGQKPAGNPNVAPSTQYPPGQQPNPAQMQMQQPNRMMGAQQPQQPMFQNNQQNPQMFPKQA